MKRERSLRNVLTDINDEACNNNCSVEAMEFRFEESSSEVRLISLPNVVPLT